MNKKLSSLVIVYWDLTNEDIDDVEREIDTLLQLGIEIEVRTRNDKTHRMETRFNIFPTTSAAFRIGPHDRRIHTLDRTDVRSIAEEIVTWGQVK